MDDPVELSLESASTRPEPPVRLVFDDGTLELRGESAAEAVEDAASDYFDWDDRSGTWRARAVDYRAALGCLLKDGWTVKDGARHYERLELEIQDRFDPYPHQSEALEAWERAERRGVVVLPTGAGKTYVAQLAMEAAGRTTLIVVPTIDLMNQWSGVLEEHFGIEVGLLGGGYHEIEPLTVATYDSAAMHMADIGHRFGMLIFDEVHHLPSDFYRQAAEFAIAPYRLGLTATPERSDGREADLPDLVGPTAYRKSIRELSGDVLADYTVETVEVGMTEEELQLYRRARTFYRDFVDEQGIRMSSNNGWVRFLAATNRSEKGRKAFKAYRTQKRLALVNTAKLRTLFDVMERHREDRILVFTNDNESVYRISERALVPAITHQTRVKERKEILAAFNEGTYRTIVTSKVLNEGVDVPKARIGIVLSGSGSVREHVQRLGRILRRDRGREARLYELVTADTVETSVSRRRRQHDAYREESDRTSGEGE
jgi:superfamily II DNA or RNA helicase